MYIQTLILTNYCGAQSLSLNLDERLNVSVGINGAGKSTVLDAATILLTLVVSRIRTPGASGRPLRTRHYPSVTVCFYRTCLYSRRQNHYQETCQRSQRPKRAKSTQ